jgi:hypothetical protein
MTMTGSKIFTDTLTSGKNSGIQRGTGLFRPYNAGDRGGGAGRRHSAASGGCSTATSPGLGGERYSSIPVTREVDQ